MIKTLGEEMTVEEARHLIAESKARIKAKEHSARVKGMLINRDPPRGTGWCGTDDCGHRNHKHYNEAAS